MRKWTQAVTRVAKQFYRHYPRTTRYSGYALLVIVLVFYIGVYRAPGSFVQGRIVTVEEGATLTQVATQLEEENIVRSAFWLQTTVTFFGGERVVHAGDYFFAKKKTLGGVASMLVRGKYGLDPLRVTVPEGSSVQQIAEIMSAKVTSFDSELFLQLAGDMEGYLFPDTYFFLPNVDARQVVQVLDETFVERISEIEEELASFGRPLDEVVTMASILEREAYTEESRRIIAGILWKRIEIGMPLQVDATFDYINGKNTFELSLDDLQIESPYNTYRNRGLPPTPIANPGLKSILAAVTPINTDYLYFLSDKQGGLHYSETFDEHKRKKALYLN